MSIPALTRALTDLFQGHDVAGSRPRLVYIIPRAPELWISTVHFLVTVHSTEMASAILKQAWALILDSSGRGLLTLSLSIAMRSDTRHRSASRGTSRGRSGTPGPRPAGQPNQPASSQRSQTPSKHTSAQPIAQSTSSQHHQRPTSMAEACVTLAGSRPAGARRAINVLCAHHSKATVLDWVSQYDPSKAHSADTSSALASAAKLAAASNAAPAVGPTAAPTPTPPQQRGRSATSSQSSKPAPTPAPPSKKASAPKPASAFVTSQAEPLPAKDYTGGFGGGHGGPADSGPVSFNSAKAMATPTPPAQVPYGRSIPWKPAAGPVVVEPGASWSSRSPSSPTFGRNGGRHRGRPPREVAFAMNAASSSAASAALGPAAAPGPDPVALSRQLEILRAQMESIQASVDQVQKNGQGGVDSRR